MTEYRKPISYKAFMALTPEKRKEHSTYFLQSNP